MKGIFCAIFLVVTCICRGQSTFSLEEYTPKFSFQTEGDCFAYATAYMALSTQLAYEAKIKNPGKSFALSYDFTEAILAFEEREEENFRTNAARELYNITSSDELGPLDYTFYTLYKYGTVKFDQFTGGKINTESPQMKMLIRFPKPREVFNLYNDTFNLRKANELKSYILAGKPIIISINQPEANCDRWKIAKKVRTKIQHIVTIIGFRDNTLLIQNNYGAANCRYYYTIDEIANIIEWAYVYDKAGL